MPDLLGPDEGFWDPHRARECLKRTVRLVFFVNQEPPLFFPTPAWVTPFTRTRSRVRRPSGRWSSA